MKEAAVCHSVAAHPHVNVLGIEVSAINMDDAIDLAVRWIATGRSGYICMSGVHGVSEAQSSVHLRKILNAAVMNAPDGMPMSWIGWLRGHTHMDRVYGPDFMTNLCRVSISRGYRHYLYGGQPGVAQALKNALEERFEGLQIVGTFSPPFRPLTPGEEDAFLADVWQAKPDILWVGLSTPKQECFMAEYVERLGVPLLVGVGAAFDFHVGRIHDAPRWIKRTGFQWLHRLLQEPRRLWKRYLLNNPVFLWRISLQLLKLRSYEDSIVSTPKAASSTTNS
ncbi:MAG TPA: WecB/TagA/CpsF family glycosyltransferase [Bryocella sp.]|nr:WecB/TagA/CpsF family glycosyltransferase [Bryocella sp.]